MLIAPLDACARLVCDYVGGASCVAGMQEVVYDSFFDASEYRKIAERYQGKRYELRLEVQLKRQELSALVAHTHLMLRENRTMQGFLWRVTRASPQGGANGITERCTYLFGVSHGSLLPRHADGSSFLHPTVTALVARVQNVWVEFNVTNPREKAALQNATLDMVLCQGKRLQQVEPPYPPTPIDLAMLPLLGSEVSFSMDQEVMKLAAKLKKPVFSFESPEAHAGFMFSLPPEKYSNLNLTDRVLEQVDFVQHGNLDGLTHTMTHPSSLESIDVPLHNARNEKMAKKISICLNVYSETLCAIGAAHFLGETGILAHLTRSDPKLKIERILMIAPVTSETVSLSLIRNYLDDIYTLEQIKKIVFALLAESKDFL